MKTKPTLLIIAVIACLLGINSCCRRDFNRCKNLSADIIPNQLIVQFDSNKTIVNIREKLKEIQTKFPGVTYDSCGCGLNIVLLEFPPNMGQDQRGEVAGSDLDQEGKFPNLRLVLDPVPIPNVLEYKDLPDTTFVGFDIIVAVIDGGIKKDDESLKNRLWINPDYKNSCYKTDLFGYDFVHMAGYDKPSIINAHGTQVSKLIVENIGEKVNVQLMDLRIFDEKGEGRLFHALCALDYAVNNGADLINMSWGYYKSSEGSNDSLLLEFLKKTEKAYITVLASAGNDTINTDCCLHFPSGFYADKYNLNNIISVAALTKPTNVRLADYSNWGKQTVSVAAQGTFKSDQGVLLEGTSYATPLVTRQAATIISDNRTIMDKDLVICIEGNTERLEGPKEIKKGRLIMETPTCE